MQMKNKVKRLHKRKATPTIDLTLRRMIQYERLKTGIAIIVPRQEIIRTMSTEEQMKASITSDETTQEKHPIQAITDGSTSSGTFMENVNERPYEMTTHTVYVNVHIQEGSSVQPTEEQGQQENWTIVGNYKKYERKLYKNLEWVRKVSGSIRDENSPSHGFCKENVNERPYEMTTQTVYVNVHTQEGSSVQPTEEQGQQENWTIVGNYKKYERKLYKNLEWVRNVSGSIRDVNSPSHGFCKLLETIRDDREKSVRSTLGRGRSLEKSDTSSFKELEGRWEWFVSIVAKLNLDANKVKECVAMKCLSVETTHQQDRINQSTTVAEKQVCLEELSRDSIIQMRPPEPQDDNINCHINRPDDPENIEKRKVIWERYGVQLCERVLIQVGYITVYNSEKRLAITYEYLKPENLYGDATRKKSFVKHPGIDQKYSPTDDNFTNNEYHHGHLAASGNYKNSQVQRNETNLFTNCVPQKTNGSSWEMIEEYVRGLLKTYPSLLIITGHMMVSHQPDIMIYKKHGQLSVPTHLFKIVITEEEEQPHGMAVFIEPNSPELMRFDGLSAYEKLEKIENCFGYRFAPNVDTKKLYELPVALSGSDYKMFITKKKLQKAKSIESLEKAYKSLNGLKPSGSLEQLYEVCKQTFV